MHVYCCDLFLETKCKIVQLICVGVWMCVCVVVCGWVGVCWGGVYVCVCARAQFELSQEREVNEELMQQLGAASLAYCSE